MSGRTLYAWFAESVARFPDATALEVGGESLSYRELEDRAARLAGAIVARCGGVPARVGLLAARSVVAYAGYLAVLRLGAAVVPLNPTFPRGAVVVVIKSSSRRGRGLS